MVWNGMEDDFSIFHTGNFFPFHFRSIPLIFHFIFHSILKFSSIFHSILKFSSIFHSILPYHGKYYYIIPYHGKFRPVATRNLYCTFATLSIPLQVVARKDRQYDTMHLITYLKHYHNELLYHKNSLSIKISTT